jgi:hypothetical protein
MRQLLMAILLLAAAMAAPARPDGANPARELVEHAIANQHRNDAAIYEYERVEERVSYGDGGVDSDEIYRLVPTGTDRLSLLLRRDGRPVDLATYQKELEAWQDALQLALDPNDPREQQQEAKRRERDRKRSELIDAVGRAFHFQWLGERVENGRKLAEIELDPNPDFQPISRENEMLRHVRATAWIDEDAGELVRGRAEITSSIPVGAGIVARIYPGGWFQIDQAEVAPGIWLPTRSEYSIRGRMFLFSVAEHKLTKDWNYRRVGSPQQALAVARQDLASHTLFSPGP